MVEKIDAAAHRHVGAAFTAVDSAAIRVHRERCAKVRNRNVACLKCAAACTSGCIALVEGELVIDAARCVGCGTCATVCPTCALESLNPSDAELAGACLSAVRDGRVVVGCGLALEALDGLVDSAAVVPVVCAGRVDESLLCTLAARGVREATVLCGRCDRCAQRHGAATAVLVAETARTLLDAWGASLAVRVTDEVPQFLLAEGVTAAAAARARDDFFADGRACAPVVREGDAAADGAVSEGGPRPVGRGPVSLSSPEAEAADTTVGPGLRFFWNSGHSRKVASHSLHVMKDGTLPHFVPDRRERLLDALAALGEPADSSVACRLWGTVVIDGAKCVSCRMCATFCPTGAITRFQDEDGAIGVDHRPYRCVQCRLCEDICMTGALSVSDAVSLDDFEHGRVHRIPMRPPAWTPNKPDSIFTKMNQVIGGEHNSFF